jgi:hypothetical protein
MYSEIGKSKTRANQPVSLASSPSAFASSRLSNRFASYTPRVISPAKWGKEAIKTHYSGLELWWLAIKDIGGLDAIFDNTNGAIKETHQMAKKDTRIR